MENRELDLKFTNIELGALKDALAHLKEQNTNKDERNEALKSEIEETEAQPGGH